MPPRPTDPHWYRQKVLLQAAVAEHGSVSKVGEHFDIPRATLAHWAARHGVRSGHPKTPGPLKAEPLPRTGCTYIIEAVGEQLYKIGRTGGDARARLQRLRTGSPVPLELVLVLDHPLWEDVLHHHYRNQRQHGEWFALTRTDIEEIATWAIEP